MKRALILACGNAQCGDDGVALEVAASLRSGLCDPETQIHSCHQWMPELAHLLSETDIAIFVDASSTDAPGEIRCRLLEASEQDDPGFTHFARPETLLFYADLLYGRAPERAYLVTIGGASFELEERLSKVALHAVPHAVDHIKALLSGVTEPMH